jgi:bacterial/archaeal transporter family-2 protein
MQAIGAAWLYPLILVAGALQAWGPPMNGALRNALTNPWLASLVSFLPIVAFLTCVLLCQPRPMPTAEGVAAMPWWAPLGGLVGAFAVVAGLLFVNQVGAGAFAGLTITANILMSLIIDKYGWFGMDVHPLGGGRMLGAALMVAGITLISRF